MVIIDLWRAMIRNEGNVTPSFAVFQSHSKKTSELLLSSWSISS